MLELNAVHLLGLALAFLIPCIGLGVVAARLSRSLRRADELSDEADRLARRLETANDALNGEAAEGLRLQEQVSTLTRAVDEARKGARTSAMALTANHANQLQKVDQAREAAEARVVRLLEELGRSEQEAEDLGRRYDVEQGRLSATRADLAHTRSRLTEAQATLKAVGLDDCQEAKDPAASPHRGSSRELLSSLVASTDGQAAAIVDGRGLPLLAVGDPRSISRLSALSSMLDDEVGAALALTLGEQPASVSLTGPTGGRHFARMEANRTLALHAHGPNPQFAWAWTVFQLQGGATIPRAAPPMPSHVPELPDPSNAELEPLLVAWGARWQARGVAVMDADGHPMALTPGEDAGVLWALRMGLEPLWLRLERDRQPIDQMDLMARGSTGVVTVRALDPDRDTHVLVVSSDSPLPPRALDELAATLRWNRTAPVREAS